MKFFVHYWFEATHMGFVSEIDHKHPLNRNVYNAATTNMATMENFYRFKAQKISTSVTASQE